MTAWDMDMWSLEMMSDIVVIFDLINACVISNRTSLYYCVEQQIQNVGLTVCKFVNNLCC